MSKLNFIGYWERTTTDICDIPKILDDILLMTSITDIIIDEVSYRSASNFAPIDVRLNSNIQFCCDFGNSEIFPLRGLFGCDPPTSNIFYVLKNCNATCSKNFFDKYVHNTEVSTWQSIVNNSFMNNRKRSNSLDYTFQKKPKSFTSELYL